MKTNTRILCLALLVLIVWGCKTNNPAVPGYTGDNSETSLDWDGSYSGVLPCADCEGIQTMLTLNQDKTYEMSTEYLGKSDEKFINTGNFQWDESGNIIELSEMDEGPKYFQVGETNLFMLDQDKNRMTGELSSQYNLKKLDMEAKKALTGKKWKLMELMGKPIEQAADEKNMIFLAFDEQENRVHGFAGCNNFFGGFEWKGDTRIKFSRLASSQKYCEATMEIEDQIMKLLPTVDNYTLNENTLSLNRARMAPLARFEAMEEGEEEQ